MSQKLRGSLDLSKSLQVGEGITLTEQAAPSTPAANKIAIYAKDASGTSALYIKNDAGTETQLGSTAVSGQYVLNFDSTKHQHVHHGQFWETIYSSALATRVFWWEAWIKPDGTGGYFVSEGYGSGHAMLFGTQADAAHGGGSTYCLPTGNIMVAAGPTILSFGADDGGIAGEWVHFAVGSDGTRIITYINGVPSGFVYYPVGTYPSRYAEQGTLFIGGSGHNNFGGSLAMLRAFEGNHPLDDAGNSGDTAHGTIVAFRPESRFGTFAQVRGKSNVIANIIYPVFLADYTSPASTIVDLSPSGFNSKFHNGQLWGTDTGGDSLINQGFGTNPTQSAYPLPQFTVDLTSPTAARTTSPIVPVSATLTPPSTPVGALIFDSFSRANQTYAFDTASPTLGSTEAGSLGTKQWQHNVPAATVTIDATSGSYYLTYKGVPSVAIAFNASAATVKSALEGISTVGTGNARVSLSGSVYTIRLASYVGIPSGANFQSTSAASIVVNATGGSFTVTYLGQTATIPYGSTAAQFKVLFEALSSVGAGNTIVTLSGSTYNIAFFALTHPNTSNFTTNASGLTGGAGTATVLASSLAGNTATAAVYAPSERGDTAFKWGILNGRACPLGGTGSYQVAWVDVGQSNMKVSVKRRPISSLSDGTTGIAFRVREDNRFNYVAINQTEGYGCELMWGYYDPTASPRANNGGQANGVNIKVAPHDTALTLSVEMATGSNLGTIRLNGTAVVTNYDFTSIHAAGTGAGLFMADFGSGMRGTARFDDFLVETF